WSRTAGGPGRDERLGAARRRRRRSPRGPARCRQMHSGRPARGATNRTAAPAGRSGWARRAVLRRDRAPATPNPAGTPRGAPKPVVPSGVGGARRGAAVASREPGAGSREPDDGTRPPFAARCARRDLRP
ncbi:MAG: hypothetical protein AVDCRST_MAG49-175, partial [uncultured Thermomicrobiales bacterium]